MSGKTGSTALPDSSSACESDQEEYLDLTDTRLLPSYDVQLTEYINILDDKVPEEDDVSIHRWDDDVDDDVDNDDDEKEELKTSFSAAVDDDSPVVDELPDYESPPEEDREIDPDEMNKQDTMESDNLTDDDHIVNETEAFPEQDTNSPEGTMDFKDAYFIDDDAEDNLHDLTRKSKQTEAFPEQDSSSAEGTMDFKDAYYIDDDAEDDFHEVARKSKVEKFKIARIPPYSVKDRHKLLRGKGKQPVSGKSRYKTTIKQDTSPLSMGGNEEVIVSDSCTPVYTEDDSTDTGLLLAEEGLPAAPAALMSCESCSKEEGHNSLVQCCDGHIVCSRCVEGSAKKVLVGEMKGSVECPQSQCNSAVPISELRKALPSIVLDLLEDRWNKETMEALENMKDVVKCPGCSFSAVLDISLKRFQCIQCNEAFCRFCDFKWLDRKRHDLCMRTKQWTSTVTGNVVNIPGRWSDATDNATDSKTDSHMMIELDASCEEFLDVVHIMNRHMQATVKKIFRVQNERLWEKYSLTRSHMVADLGELNINEKRLFHGTHRDVIEPICREGFDWRLCGKHGTVYGQGTYFAKNPIVSHRYSSGLSSRSSGLSFLASLGRPRSGATNLPNSGFPFGPLGGASQGSGFSFGSPAVPTPTTSNSKIVFKFGPPGRTSQTPGFSFGLPPPQPTTCVSMNVPHGVVSQSGSFNFGTATATGNSNTGFTFGRLPCNAHPGLVKHSTTTSSRSDTANLSKQSMSTNTGSHAAGSSACSAAGLQSSAISSTTKDPSHGNRKCHNCIFCVQKRKTDQSNADRRRVDIMSGLLPPSITFQQGSGVGGAVPSGPVNTGNGNSNSLPSADQMGDMQKQKKQKMDPTQPMNTGAHLFVRSIPNTLPSSGLSFGTSSSSNLHSTTGNLATFGGNSHRNVMHSGSGMDHGRDDCFMFLARVLVGRSCKGSHTMRRPERNSAGQETHSAVDKEPKPSIFVIFDNNQCYPEYIVQYSTSM